MAEQLPIVAARHWSTKWHDWEYYSSDNVPAGSGEHSAREHLTPHAPAQSALDELRREVEALRADRGRLRKTLKDALDVLEAVPTGAIPSFADEIESCVQRIITAIDAARASTDEGVGK